MPAAAEAPAPKNHIKLPGRIENRREKSSGCISSFDADETSGCFSISSITLREKPSGSALTVYKSFVKFRIRPQLIDLFFQRIHPMRIQYADDRCRAQPMFMPHIWPSENSLVLSFVMNTNYLP